MNHGGEIVLGYCGDGGVKHNTTLLLCRKKPRLITSGYGQMRSYVSCWPVRVDAGESTVTR